MSSKDAAHLLRSHELRVTPQRRAILNAFRGSADEHLSAEDVLSRAGAEVPEIGRGTVYATLAELTELGLLASVGTPEPVRYEVNVDPHDHFRCRLCLRLFDVELGGRDLQTRELPGYKVDAVTVRAEGLCAQCHDYERGLRSGARQVRERPTLSDAQIEELSCLRVASPMGDLAFAASKDGICRVAFADHADFDSLGRRARTRRGAAAARARARALGVTFTGYFGGGRERPEDVVDWRLMAEETAAVLRAVQAIPYAEPRSYHLLMDGLSAYDCGVAIGANPMPLLVPCHRVSRGAARLQGYVGGLERLQFLQGLEVA
jgi:Fur family ferric uptake transcriptional regulator/Fur family peroxide stress response transcriptional regulator